MANLLAQGQRQETIDRIEKLRAEGMPLREACKKLDISDNTYYGWRSILKKATQAAAPKKAHKFVDIPHTPQVTHKDQVAIVVCSVENLKSVLSGLV